MSVELEAQNNFQDIAWSTTHEDTTLPTTA